MPESPADDANAPTTPTFLAGGGEMGERIRLFDWATSPLGAPAAWPSGLRTLVQVMLTSRQPMFIAWGPKRVMLYNDGYAPMCANRHPWALGQSFEDVWADIIADVGPIMDAAYAGEATYMDDIEFLMTRHGQQVETHFSFGYTPVHDANDAVAGMFCTALEITSEVKNAKVRNAEFLRMRDMLEKAPSFMAVLTGPDHVFELTNAAYMQLIGHRDVIGKPVRTALPEIEGQGFYELLDNVYQTGKPFVGRGLEISLQLQAGAPLQRAYLNFVYQPIRDDRGSVTGIFAEGSDVTDRVVAEANLRALNETLEHRVGEALAERSLFAEFVNNAKDPILACDFKFNILAINVANIRAMEAVYGVSPKAGDNLLAVMQGFPDHQDQIKQYFQRALTGEEFTIVDEFGDPGRERLHLEVRFSALRDRHGVRIGAFQVARDISDRIRSEAALAVAQEALRQAQKMEAVGQLTGGLAHDFNNILAGISGSLEMAQNRVSQGRIAELDRYLTAAQGATRRAAALTHRLLAFSRRQTLDPKPTDVNRLVMDMTDLIVRTVGPAITVTRQEEKDLWSTLVDPNQLENALLNLCINARDAMPDGGDIVIRTANVTLEAREAAEHDVPAGRYVSMCVSDGGTGMSEDVAARAFDPFFTTKPIGVGTGLGLSMIYGFARQSGGNVQIDTVLGRGTTICIYLPRHDVAESVGENSAVALDMLQARSGQTVLVIDDEALLRMLVVEVLEEMGYRALEAGDGPEGMKILQSDETIDLLMTDVGLPNGMNGRQVADAARQLRPDLKILFVTGYAENAVLSDGNLEPGMQVVTKPFSMDELSRRVKAMIEG